MRRRTFIEVIAALAAAYPFAAGAQQSVIRVVGFLSSRSLDDSVNIVAALKLGLKETGFTEGQNLRVEYRWADGNYDRLPALAADLVRQKVAVIFATGSTLPALAAKA